MINLRVKVITRKSLMIMISTGNWYIGYSVLLHLKQKFAIQYKLLNNVLYLNKKLYHFGIISQSKCSFCELCDEATQHLFRECTFTQNLWNQLWLYVSRKATLPVLNPQRAIFGFTDVLDYNYLLVNHLLLIFRYNVFLLLLLLFLLLLLSLIHVTIIIIIIIIIITIIITIIIIIIISIINAT